MKVGIIAPLSISLVHGGVRTQAMMTAHELRTLGHDVELVSPFDDSFDHDIAHVFAAGPETTGIAHLLSSQQIPFVLSPVFYSNRSASILKLSLAVEKIMGIFGSGIRSDFGIKAEVCNAADLILPNTQLESDLLADGFSLHRNKLKVIPNGVEARFKDADPSLFFERYGLKDFVLCTAQASAPRKNVRLLLEAAPRIDADIVIIGSFDNSPYSRQCQQIAANNKNIHLIGGLDHSDPLLASAYAACKSFVLPSMYETPGIAALEAALAGANIVITKNGGTKEYFRDMAEYIDPKSKNSLINALSNSLHKDLSSDLKERILSRYTWSKVAAKTAEAYKKLLS